MNSRSGSGFGVGGGGGSGGIIPIDEINIQKGGIFPVQLQAPTPCDTTTILSPRPTIVNDASGSLGDLKMNWTTP